MTYRTPMIWLNGLLKQMSVGESIPPVFGGSVVYRGNVAQASGTTVIPYDNTVPTIAEGTQLWSATVTPTVVGGNMAINFAGMIDLSKADIMATVAVFRNNVMIGYVATSSSAYSGNRPTPISLVINDPVVSLTPVTYSCRIGVSVTGNTWYFGKGATANQGGLNNSGWTITETL
jgi:hypothetical protein